jgi:peptidoglycan/xylan/chitin deacetylase (PgdA/CDA1 family)
VTTSWDDGHKLDLRLADLLSKHGLRGTFYISPFNHEFDRRDLLTDREIRRIGEGFEIGSHTLTHPELPNVPVATAVEEISGSKTLLENIVGTSMKSFCYPRGTYLPLHREIVKESGYLFARTVTRYAFDIADPYEAATSLHAYNHWTDLWKIANFARFKAADFLRCRQWDHLSNAMFDHVLEAGGIYHLWGHSWEIDAHGDWQRLDRALGYLSGRPGVLYLTNGDLVSPKPQAYSWPASC